jgi:hypothetical protein
MSQQAEVVTRSMARFDPGHRQQRPHILGVGMHVAPEQTHAHSGKQMSDAEVIIGELVSQFLRCPTSHSGIFRCW